jgi:hypothetical protein
MAPPLRLQASNRCQGKLLAISRSAVLRMLTGLCLPPWGATMIAILMILIEGQRALEI